MVDDPRALSAGQRRERQGPEYAAGDDAHDKLLVADAAIQTACGAASVDELRIVLGNLGIALACIRQVDPTLVPKLDR